MDKLKDMKSFLQIPDNIISRDEVADESKGDLDAGSIDLCESIGNRTETPINSA